MSRELGSDPSSSRSNGPSNDSDLGMALRNEGGENGKMNRRRPQESYCIVARARLLGLGRRGETREE
jgi:hypothetical protein